METNQQASPRPSWAEWESLMSHHTHTHTHTHTKKNTKHVISNQNTLNQYRSDGLKGLKPFQSSQLTTKATGDETIGRLID